MKLTSSLVRLSLLLFALSFVGVVGLNGSIDPTHVRHARAASLDIVMQSNGSDSLVFQIGVDNCPASLAPGDACSAHVVVTNQGDETAEISPPQASVSGSLKTCSGDDPANPGSDGDNIALRIENQTYNEAVHLLDPGDSESFDVTFALDMDMGNTCQARTATILVTLRNRLPIGEDEEPQEETTPSPQPSPTATPFAQVSGSIATPTPAPVRTNEVLPTRLPVTGQGWQPEDHSLLKPLTWAAGAAGAIALGLAALLATGKRARQ
jgi:hypothetical protein